MNRTHAIALIVVGILFSALPTVSRGADTAEELGQAARNARDRARAGYEDLRRRRTFNIDGVPYGATALPIVFFTPSSGLHYGGWVEVANYQRQPYVYRANVQWYLTTKGRRNHHMRLEFPTLFGLPVNVRLLTRDLKNTGSNFFGIGNFTEIDSDKPDYYSYLMEEQRSAIDLEIAGFAPLVVFGGVRFNRSVPSRIDESEPDGTYFVFDKQPPGVGGGWANFFLAGLLYDSRDDQEMPTAGMLSEASYQKGVSWLGANWTYRRITLIHTHYYRLKFEFDPNRYVLVNRVVFENLSGNAPFYELTEIGGSIRGIEIGGGAFMRGYESRRYADKQKFLFSSELRRIFKDVEWRGQYFQMLGMVFVDAGRVASEVTKLNPVDLHWSGGAGLRLTWNSQLSIRADIAYSPEGHKFLMAFGNLF